MSGGRPPIYSEEILKKARAYLESSDKKGSKIILVKAEGLALELGVRRETLYDWAKEHEEFSNILEEMNQKQAQKLIDLGLIGEFNPAIAKLVLGKHGYHDKQDSDVNVKLPKPILGYALSTDNSNKESSSDE